MDIRLMTEVLYDRRALVETLIYHWPMENNSCLCGWAKLGRAFPEHVADVYEEFMAQRPD